MCWVVSKKEGLEGKPGNQPDFPLYYPPTLSLPPRWWHSFFPFSLMSAQNNSGQRWIADIFSKGIFFIFSPRSLKNSRISGLDYLVEINTSYRFVFLSWKRVCVEFFNNIYMNIFNLHWEATLKKLSYNGYSVACVTIASSPSAHRRLLFRPDSVSRMTASLGTFVYDKLCDS